MDADSKALDKLQLVLIQTISDFLDRRLPLRRIILVASLLKHCHIELPIAKRLTHRLLNEQHKDGGWVDCEDTAWALYFLDDDMHKKRKDAGIQWLENERNAKKGWGFCKRDHPCIPITAQVLYFLSDIGFNLEAIRWLEREWSKDIESVIKINYKAAWYMLAYIEQFEKTRLTEDLFYRTTMYLLEEQRRDGSWGPWKKHPASSDCFSTGICMAALAQAYRITRNKAIKSALLRSIQWIKNNQLKSGLFPTHYIEEGSAWLFWGWNKAGSLSDI
jgi:hypothetical protein